MITVNAVKVMMTMQVVSYSLLFRGIGNGNDVFCFVCCTNYEAEKRLQLAKES